MKPGQQLVILPGNHTLSANLKRLFAGYCFRDIPQTPHRVGHILTDDTVRATGNGLLEAPCLITQHQGQTVHFPADNRVIAGGKQQYIVHILGLLARQHRFAVAHCLQAVFGIRGNPTYGRICKMDAGSSFQHSQLQQHRIIFPIRHNGIVLLKVSRVCFIQFFNQFLHLLHRIHSYHSLRHYHSKHHVPKMSRKHTISLQINHGILQKRHNTA